jgi:hypothetical protein
MPSPATVGPATEFLSRGRLQSLQAGLSQELPSRSVGQYVSYRRCLYRHR